MRGIRNILERVLTSILIINFTSEIPHYRKYSRKRISNILPRLTNTTTGKNSAVGKIFQMRIFNSHIKKTI